MNKMIQSIKTEEVPYLLLRQNTDTEQDNDNKEEKFRGREVLIPSPRNFCKMKTGGRPIRVLCMDGGGLRGIFSCQILRVLFGDNDVNDLFDLVVGTSTGGLLAAGLCNGLSIDKCAQLYDTVGDRVFHTTLEKKGDDSFFWITKKIYSVMDTIRRTRRKLNLFNEPEEFDTDALEDIIKEILSSNAFQQMKYKHPDAPHCALVSCDATHGQPFIFRTYSVEGSEDMIHPPGNALPKSLPGADTAQWWEACRATSAAPTYFRSINIEVNDQLKTFVDGGLTANDPSIIGYCEAKALFPDRDIIIISIGTGAKAPQLKRAPKNIIRLGMDISGSLFNAREALNRMCMRNLLEEGSGYFRFNKEMEHTEMSAESYLFEWEKLGKKYANSESIFDLLNKLSYLLKETGLSL